jgi:hypothetical protein
LYWRVPLGCRQLDLKHRLFSIVSRDSDRPADIRSSVIFAQGALLLFRFVAVGFDGAQLIDSPLAARLIFNEQLVWPIGWTSTAGRQWDMALPYRYPPGAFCDSTQRLMADVLPSSLSALFLDR